MVEGSCLEMLLADEVQEPDHKKLKINEPKTEYSPVPEEGYVELNTPMGSEVTFVVHKATLQRIPLPQAGPWQLVFSKDGSGAAVNDGGDWILTLQNEFGRTLVTDGDGQFYVEERGKAHPWNLDTKRSLCEAMTISLAVGDVDTRHKHQVYRLEWTRGGMHFFWDALTLHTSMKLNTNEKKRTVWLYRQKNGWRKAFKQATGTTVHYTAGSSKANKEEDDRAEDTIRLPSGSLSTYDLLHVFLTSATSQAHQAGGLKMGSAKQAAGSLFRSLVKASVYQRKVLTIQVAGDFTVEVTQGRMSIKQVRDHKAIKDNDSMWEELWTRLDVACGRGNDEIDFVDFVVVLSGMQQLDCVLNQVVWACARQIEMYAQGALKKGTDKEAPLQVEVAPLIDIAWCRERLDQELQKHLHACKCASASLRNFTVATDKANVGGPSLQNSVVVLPDGQALVLPPQVCSPFSAHIVNDGNRRHKEWSQRKAPGKKGIKHVFRPKKRHRTSVLTALKNMDRQLRVGTKFDGLRFVVRVSDEETWSDANWRNWPGLLVSSDQGGDMLSAGHCMLRYLDCNAILTWDWSHGAQRDLTLTYQAHGVWKYALIFLVCINVYSGPDQDEGMRFEQLTDAMDHFFEHYKADSFLFQSRADAMLRELGDAVQVEEGEKNIYEALWRYLRDGAQNYKKQDRMKMAHELYQRWEQERFKREYVALECGMLDKKAAAAVDKMPAGVKSHAAALTTTSSAATQADTKLLRASTANNLAMSACFMETERSKRIIAIMALLPEPLATWQGQSAKVCRDVTANRKWVLDEMSHGFAKHQLAILNCLVKTGMAKNLGFMRLAELRALENEDEGPIEIEDEFAQLAGDICAGLVARRRRRLTFMTNMWPNRAVMAMAGGPESARIAQQLELDYKVFGEVADAPDKGDKLKEQVVDLVEERWSGILSSVMIEEINNIQKNNGQCRGSMKFRRPERGLAATLSSTVLTERNKYTPVVPNVPVPRSTPTLVEQNAFGKTREESWLDKLAIASTKQAPPYWSPTAENVGQPGTDAACWRDARDHKRIGDLENCFMGCFCDYRHAIIFKRAGGTRHKGFDWHFPLFHFQDSGVAAMPCSLLPVPGHPSKNYVVFPEAADEPEFLSVFDWEGLVAMPVRWRSPAYQDKHLPKAKWEAGVRLFADGKAEPMQFVATRAAFWDLPCGTLRKIAGNIGLAPPDNPSLYEVVLYMVQEILKLSEADAADVVAQRLRYDSKGAVDETESIIMNCDEAAQCLAQPDERLVRNEQKEIQKRVDERSAFEVDFQEAAQRRRAASKDGATPPRARADLGQTHLA
ncbi:unnamed protein product [Prorocentrum cordatum]|uniref:RNA-dependent RNA polymerase n=1 Tax=Prorocentrum cordatum TaxID=2364126 RepID=A0ABN9RMU3_9DINO|nr:unnamed protein product [Polarella glacialis]